MMLLNVSEVVTCPKFAQTLTVRRTSGSWVKGVWVSDTPSEFTSKGSWQKVTARELAQIGMGEIKQEVRKLLTPTEIQVSQNNDQQSDRIIWKSGRYKVLRVDDNSDYGYYRAYASFEGVES
jgi:hypothetical protein